MAVAVLDGVLSDAEAARIPVHDRGLLFGDGVFETLRASGGRAVRLDAHLDRLLDACGRLGLPAPPRAALEADVARAVAAIGGEARVRVTVTRGSNEPGADGRPLGPDPALAPGARRLVLAAPTPPLAALDARAAAAILAPLGPLVPPTGVKSTSWAAGVHALALARAAGAAELVTTDDGWALEAATATLFAVLDGALVTPPIEGLPRERSARPRVLAGVARAALLAALGARERPVAEDELRGAREVFLASSFRSVVPLAALDGAAREAPGPAARAAARVLEG